MLFIILTRHYYRDKIAGGGAKGKVVGEGVRALLINDNPHSF